MNGPSGKGVSITSADAPEIHENRHPHFASDGDQRKALATMTARAALCGCALHELADGGYLVCKWNYSRAVPSLEAVGDLLRQIGGR